MADHYWVGGTNSWNGVGTRWATTSGGAASLSDPTSADNAFFDANSGAVTVTVSTTNGKCLNLNLTGFTGTLAGATPIDCSGALTLGAGMTFTHTGGINMVATSGTKNITTNAISLAGILTIAGAGGTFQLQDNYTGTRLIITDGIFDANNKNVTLTGVNSFIFGGSNTRSVLMGSGTWTISAASPFDASGGTTNLTFTPSTSQINLTNSTNSDLDFDCAGLTLNNVWFQRGASTGLININRNIAGTPTFNEFKDTGTASHTMVFRNTTFTFTTFSVNGTPTTTVTLSRTGAAGQFTLSKASGTVSVIHLSISNCIATGGATWNCSDGTDGGGNTGWNFVAGSRYWVGGSANWDATAGTKWSNTSGGTGGESVPTSSNNVFLDASSGASTVTIAASAQAKNFTLTGFTGTLAGSSALAVVGNLTLGSAMSMTYSGTLTLSVTGSITSSGITFSCPIILNGSGQTFTFTDAFSTTGTFTNTLGTTVMSSTFTSTAAFTLTAGSLTMGGAFSSTSTITITAGTFNANNFNVTALSVSSSNSNTRTITMGSGTWILSGTGTVWNLATVTGLTLNCNTSTIKLTDSSGSSKTFAGGSQTYNNYWNATGGAGVVIMTGSNTFADLRIAANQTQQFTAGTTTTFTTLTEDGPGITLTSVTSATHTLSCTAGTIEVQNTTISYSIATGGATFKASTSYANVDGGNNTGWIFTPNSTAAGLLFMLQ